MSKPKCAIIFGDQLNHDSCLFNELDPKKDIIVMAEVMHESTHVLTHKSRIVLFLSAMRHFYNTIKRKYNVTYFSLDDDLTYHSFTDVYTHIVKTYEIEEMICVQPGEYRVLNEIKRFCISNKIKLNVLKDTHFMCDLDDFESYIKDKKSIILEYFYRFLRKKTGYLMEGHLPVGGSWNYDKQNRESFDHFGPENSNSFNGHKANKITKKVISLVNKLFHNHPGETKNFRYAVTEKQAKVTLDAFIKNNLNLFGPYQDAMWENSPFLYHSQIGSSLNLKLISPRFVIESVLKAFHENPSLNLNSVEGFIRQILGWREYIRGLYWHYMPDYKTMNFLDAHQKLPSFFWTGDTSMNCMKHSIGQTLQHGYAHHIQRLMVTGLFALMFGVHPLAIHEWYLAVYVDAVEWVELPNTIGMSQFSDGGIVGTKPYIATGKYIDRMSNYCKGCAYNPAERTGSTACPFTVLYWDFLMRHESILKLNNRMALQVRNLNRISENEKKEIVKTAKKIRNNFSK